MANDIAGLFKNVHFVLKIVALVLCVVGVIVIEDGVLYWDNNSLGFTPLTGCTENLVEVAVLGYLLITAVFLFVYVMDSTHHLLDVTFMLIGGILNVIVGILSLIVCHKDYVSSMGSIYKRTLTLGLTSLACGVVLLIDAGLQLKR